MKYACKWFDDYEKAIKDVANVFAEVFKDIEHQLGRSLTEDEMKLGVAFGLLHCCLRSDNGKH